MVYRVAVRALACAVALAWAGAASAQTWTPEQQELWKFEELQWQMSKDKDSSWIEKMVHPNLTYWETGAPVPQNRASLSRWNRYTNANSAVLEQEIFPISITITANIAVVQYRYQIAREDYKKERETVLGPLHRRAREGGRPLAVHRLDWRRRPQEIAGPDRAERLTAARGGPPWPSPRRGPRREDFTEPPGRPARISREVGSSHPRTAGRSGRQHGVERPPAPQQPSRLRRDYAERSRRMLLIWIGFVAFILLLLALDLGVFHRKAHVVGVKEALSWSAVWIALGLAFSLFVYHGYENQWLGLGSAPDAVDRSAEFPDGRINDGRSAVDQVPDRLRGREVALGRQRVRDRDDLRLPGRAAALPAPRAVLGHPRRPRAARRDDRGRSAPDRRVLLDPDAVRRLPDRDRRQDAADSGIDRPQLHLGGAAHAPLLPRHRALPRRALPRARGLCRFARGRDPRSGRRSTTPRSAGRGRAPGC